MWHERLKEKGITMSDHKGEELKGRMKEAAGDLTGDKDLKKQGQADQRSAAAKRTIDDVADKLKDVVDPKK
jgi:uncharacterized protein YjbJ (UPF0337 family)